MKLVMHTPPANPLPVHDREGKLIGFRIVEQQRFVFETDTVERHLLRPGMVLRVREGFGREELELVVLSEPTPEPKP